MTARRVMAAPRAAVGALVGVAAGWAGSAAAQGRLTADASLSAGVTTNPFLQAGATPTAASTTLELTPEYAIATERTSLRVLGDVRLTEYSARYPTNDSYALRGRGDHRLSPTVRLDAEIGYVNSVVGSFNDVFLPVGEGLNGGLSGVPTGGALGSAGTGTGAGTIGGAGAGTAGDGAAPVAQLPGFVDDPALAGIGRRRSTYSALGGASVVLGRFDQVAARVSSALTRYPAGVALDEFNTVSAGVSYQRTLAEGFTAALNADVSRVDYPGSGAGDSTIYQPGVSVTRVLDTRWTLTASAAAALVRIAVPGGTRASTDLNGSLGVCRRDTRWNACLTATRATLPSSIQGVRTRTGLFVSGGYRVSATDDLSLSAGYSHVDAPLLRSAGPVAPTARVGGVDFATFSASYARRIAPRLSAFVSAGASKSDDEFVNRRANIEGRFGIRYRVGGRR